MSFLLFVTLIIVWCSISSAFSPSVIFLCRTQISSRAPASTLFGKRGSSKVTTIEKEESASDFFDVDDDSDNIDGMLQETTLSSNELVSLLDTKMNDSIESLKKSLSSVMVGRANPALLSPLKIKAYGIMNPIDQLASVGTVGMTQLTVEPYDKSLLRQIEKAIVNSNLGLMPQSLDGNMLYIDIPPLNEELRVKYSKQVHERGEKTKISIRNVRRAVLKTLSNSVDISKDEEKREQKRIDEKTQNYIKIVDGLIQDKETQLMTF